MARFRRGAATPARDLATVLFTDLVGSTERAAELGDRRWRELLSRHYALVRRELKRFGGREIDTAGDGVFSTFERPAAAIECACAVATGVEQLGLHIRAGIHTGEVERIGPKVGGIAVHIGARIASAAGTGQVLVSGTVRELVSGSNYGFEDRGAHALKGVPGEWHLYAVDRSSVTAPPEEPLPAEPEAPRARRARRRTLLAVGALGLAVVVLATILLLRGGSSGEPVPGPDMVGRIDPASGRFVGSAIKVGGHPSGVTIGAGSVWVANFADRTLSRIDPSSGTVIRTPSIGGSPTGIAFGDGSVWITAGFGLQSGASGSLIRFDAGVDQITKQLDLGSGVQGVAFGGGAVWVTNVNQNTLTRIEPSTNSPGDPVTVGDKPEAVTADDRGVWVASTLDQSVSHLDPSGGSLGDVQLRSGPTAIALGEGGVWVASGSANTVTRIDPATGSLVETIPVGRNALGIAAGAGAVWVAESGQVQRIDPATNRVTATIVVGGVAEGIAVGAGGVWVAVHAA